MFKLKPKPVRNVTRRFVLQIGFSCNAKCRFCYYKESLKKGTVRDYTTNEVKTKLREGRRLGKNMVDISGGEPTIRRDIFEIISYAKKIGYKKICLLTNGIRMADKSFSDKLVKAGMNEVLFSVHSPIEKDHDYLIGVVGSYQKIISALKYLSKRRGASIRINSTISGFNYNTVDRLFELVKPYNPDAVNILVLNPSNETLQGSSEGFAIKDYNKVSSKISDAISRYEKYFKVINVRWIPFCLLKGHEDKIRTMWQKIYEDEEWDPYMNIKYNKGMPAVIASFFAGCLIYPFRKNRYGTKNFYTLFNEILSVFRELYFYKHLNECKICSLRKICPGMPRDYIKHFGERKIKLRAYNLGKVIEDPLYFCRNYKNNFESLRLSH